MYYIKNIILLIKFNSCRTFAIFNSCQMYAEYVTPLFHSCRTPCLLVHRSCAYEGGGSDCGKPALPGMYFLSVLFLLFYILFFFIVFFSVLFLFYFLFFFSIVFIDFFHFLFFFMFRYVFFLFCFY